MSADKPRIVELQSQYGKFEVILNNPHAKRLTIIMLGDRHKGFIPPPRMFDEFREKLEAAMAEPGDRVVLSHPFVSALQIDLPEGPVVVTSPASKELAPGVVTEVVHPVPGETYRVGEDDQCFVVSSGDSERAPKVWLSLAMVQWLFFRKPPAGAVVPPNQMIPHGSNGQSVPDPATKEAILTPSPVQEYLAKKDSSVVMSRPTRDYWYLIEGKRVPIPREGLHVIEAYDTPVSVFQVTPRRMPADSPFHRGMSASHEYQEALAKDHAFILDVSRIYLHGAS